uniref:Rho GTPase activating protein 29 n=1 Tax=Nothoprocta perdicaria TaxID=30464 RepID=A0A8C6YWI0_NOTPE
MCSFPFSEHQDGLHHVVHERLGESLRVLKAVINKHQTLNSVDILSAAGTVIAKVKGKEIIAFQNLGNAILCFSGSVSDFLMGDVDNGSSLGLPVSRRSRCVVMSKTRFPKSGALFSGHLRGEEVDSMLLRNDTGIESALAYAKAWSKYTKDVVAWVEKKLSLGEWLFLAFNHLSFVTVQIFEKNKLSTISLFCTLFFFSVQPLLGRKNELDRQRKDIKELWQREQKKMQELEAALRKAKLLYIQRQDEYEKAKSCTARAEEEHLSSSGSFVKDVSKQLEKKRRLEEEALQKAEEANEHYKASMVEVEEKRSGLESFKSDVLTQLRELIYQCDLTLKAATVNLFQLQHAQVVSLPVNCQSLCESAKLYEPGQQYSEFVKSLPKEGVAIEPTSFETQNSQVDGEITDYLTNVRAYNKNKHLSRGDIFSFPTFFPRFLGDFKRRLPRTPSTGTMSSADDLDEREPPSPSDCLNDLTLENAHSPGPFRNANMSKAAQTHKLRKLRAPSKSECEEVSGKVVQTAAWDFCEIVLNLIFFFFFLLHLFGVEFAQAAKNIPDGIPFIIKKCTSEIESRALNVKVCLSLCGVCSVLKVKFLFPQLPEPLILFRLYNEFIGLAKESQNVNEELDAKQASPRSKKRQSICIELNRIIIKIKDLLKQLPVPNYNTLQYLIGHLHRVTEQSDENKMSASNLGIIFGPTLIRPRQTDATVSLSSLVDYPYQARMVELLITHYEKIFDISLQPLLSASQSEETAVTIGVALSTEEREPQQPRKSFVAVKEVTMIVTNVPQENRALESGTAGALSSSCSVSNNSVNAILPSKPYSLSLRSARTTEGNGSDAHPLAAFRAPRTLQPPPGTFYKPPSNKSKQNEEGSSAKVCLQASASTVLPQDNAVKLAGGSALLPSDPIKNTSEQKTSSEDIHPADLKPAYQRLRPKRIQELEHREAHFV